MTTSPRTLAAPPPRGNRRSAALSNAEVPTPAPIFGWPQAFALALLTPASFAFTFLLLRSGQDAHTAVITTLVLLTGVAVIVFPSGGGAVLRRLGAAIAAGVTHGGGRR